MAKKPDYSTELEKFREYLRSPLNEDAKAPLLHPLFKKLFPEKFKIESNASGADVYVEGQLIVECKTDYSQWLEGFYQALHYHRKYGLVFNTLIVIAHKFIGIWKLDKLPEFAIILERTAQASTAPNIIGKENAKKTNNAVKQELKNAAFYWLEPKDLDTDLVENPKNLTIESYQILKILDNLDSDRLQINSLNFIQTIEKIKSFFEKPIDAIHAFYTIIAYWDITSTVAQNENGELSVIGFKGNRMSDAVQNLPNKQVLGFKKFIENQYIFTNEGSGVTVDYYFSRFDEVLAQVDPEYVKQHGIFFTNDYLSKFALWFVKRNFTGNIDENYFVFDPAGGSGNLVSSWRGKLKHKIIAELEPDLLKTIDRRMKADPFHIDSGFTIVPKLNEKKGLNFLDKTGTDYFTILKNAVKESTNLLIDKPLAFLLNPPYKNTDEKQITREDKDAHYQIHSSIIELTGDDASKERYLAFLGQIINIANAQTAEFPATKPVVMIFTPSSWLLPRPTYIPFRQEWDKNFQFHSGFIVTSNEWFKLDGKWPLAFTIWTFNKNDQGNENTIKVSDFTDFKKSDLNIDWESKDKYSIDNQLDKLVQNRSKITFTNTKGDIRTMLPKVEKNGNWIEQSRLNLYRNLNKDEIDKKIVSGFPLKDIRHQTIKAPHGSVIGNYVGFMDNNTPVRIKQDPSKRLTNQPDRVWFRLDSVFININQTKTFSGPADNRSYCAYDLPSAKATFSWFAITKALNGKYPLWANQYDLWIPNISESKADEWYALCFAFVLASNRCVVTKFEKDNPVKDAPEVFVDNPLSTNNKENFWNITLDNEVKPKHEKAFSLVQKVKQLYQTWNRIYCKGQKIEYVGLENEPYFMYFDYPDFLTPNSGLVQIKKYTELQGLSDMETLFDEVNELTKEVREEIYKMLVTDFGYFE